MGDSNANNLQREGLPVEDDISEDPNGSGSPTLDDTLTGEEPAPGLSNQPIHAENMSVNPNLPIPHHEPLRVRLPPRTIRTDLIPVGIHRYKLVYLDELPEGNGDGDGDGDEEENEDGDEIGNEEDGDDQDDDSSSDETGSTTSSSSSSTLGPDDVLNGQIDFEIEDENDGGTPPPPPPPPQNEPNPQSEDDE